MKSEPQPHAPALVAAPAGGWLALGFLLLAALMLTGLWDAKPEIPPAVRVEPAALGPVPLRSPVGDPPATVIDGLRHACADCHRLFPTEQDPDRTPTMHAEVRLNHGLNSRCANCHDRRAHDRLVLLDGSTVPFSQAPRLCASCHGTTYRDWERGMHGKTLGSWDRSDPRFRRLSCIECHDPHSPAFGRFTPLPPPRTLRMGDAAQHAHEGKRDPLEHWIHRHADPPEQEPVPQSILDLLEQPPP